jgi:hypothetical protein
MVQGKSRLAVSLMGTLLGLAVGGLCWRLADGDGLLYLCLFAVATTPGWPIGWALFGRAHGAGWIAGALIGYVLTAFTIWLTVRLGYGTFSAFLTGWAVLLALCALFALLRQPAVTLLPWSRRETTWLLVVLLVVPILVAPPFLNLGKQDAEGNRQYRAYFTADFLWHMALTDELQRFRLPPANPYAADLPLNYYWTYFLFPAATLAGPLKGRMSVEHALLVNAVAAGLLFVGMIFVVARRVARKPAAAAIGVLLAVLAASAEGTYALWDLAARGRPLAGVRMLNIDAITLWFFQGLTIDGLTRSLWYTPQHAMACALGLIALLVAGSGAHSIKTAAFAGLALAAAVSISPFLGGSFALIYGIAVLTQAAIRARPFLPAVLPHAIAAALTVLAIGWCIENQMLEGARGALQLGFRGNAARSSFITMGLALGPLLLPALGGLVLVRKLEASVIPIVAALLVGLGLFYFVSIGGTDPVWVGWRAGQILLVTLPALAALFFARASESRAGRWCAGALAVVLFAVGVPTTAIDVYNAQDVTNHGMGPGFPWTVVITPHQQAAFDWLKASTPEDAVVQMDPTARGRATWTLIPTFAQRRMAAGLPISLVMTEDYRQRSQRVREMYRTEDAQQAWSIAHAMRIDYVYVDRTEREAFGESAMRKFDGNPEYFRLMFRSDDVSIYAISD